MFTADDCQLHFRHFASCIKIDGKPLKVYTPQYDEETKTASGWIVSEPGTEYSISWRRTKDVESDVGADVFLDGQSDKRTCPGGLMRRERKIKTWQNRLGARVGPNTLRPFVFAKLKTTDDPDLLADSSSPQQPGTIVLKIHRVIIGGLSDKPYSVTTSGPTFVDEKAKKLGCHVTEFGNQRSTHNASCLSYRPYSTCDRDPYVTFIFRYRSADILQAMGIMPPSKGKDRSRVNPEELVVVDDSDEDDELDQASDLEQDEAEIAALQSALTARMDALAAKKRVKREDVEAEMASKRRKVKKEEAINVDLFGDPDQVIDLTSD